MPALQENPHALSGEGSFALCHTIFPPIQQSSSSRRLPIKAPPRACPTASWQPLRVTTRKSCQFAPATSEQRLKLWPARFAQAAAFTNMDAFTEPFGVTLARFRRIIGNHQTRLSKDGVRCTVRRKKARLTVSRKQILEAIPVSQDVCAQFVQRSGFVQRAVNTIEAASSRRFHSEDNGVCTFVWRTA